MSLTSIRTLINLLHRALPNVFVWSLPQPTSHNNPVLSASTHDAGYRSQRRIFLNGKFVNL